MNEREHTPNGAPEQPPMYVPERAAAPAVEAEVEAAAQAPEQPAAATSVPTTPFPPTPPVPQAPQRPASRRPAPRTSPIVWGALILAFCGYIAQRLLGTGGIDLATWVATITIGLGVLLLGVGAAVLLRNRRR
ncbi:hypothetical protein [Leucobacter chromiireducens]|uniref:hypothetical protein n=1 Tax=Leucobacter chromiireducens TaxID=283877 RepID=UPI000F638DEC|nr:hypothetical protein [Leucobacter chromiireducens]